MNASFEEHSGYKKNPWKDMTQSATGAFGGLSQHPGRSHTSGKKHSPASRAPGPTAAAEPSFSEADWMLAVLEAQQRARDEAYRAAAAAQQKNYEYAQSQVDSATDRALQEAYVNKMLALRDLPQQMAGQGLSGGGSETSLAGLYNNYGNARNELEMERQQQMANLLNVYQNNMAKLETQRAGGIAQELASLVPQLTKLAARNKPITLTLAQGESPDQAAAAAMRRLRRALGLEEE